MNEILQARGTMGRRGKSRYNKWNAMKNEWETTIVLEIARQGIRKCTTFPLFFGITWICPDRRRDKDNVAAAKKIIFDALQAGGIIPNDTWAYIGGWSDQFDVDKENPRVEVKIVERKYTKKPSGGRVRGAVGKPKPRSERSGNPRGKGKQGRSKR